MLTAFDTADVVTGHAHELRADGITAVGVYARLDRAPTAMLEGLHEVGIQVWVAFEHGSPTSDGYFTHDQAAADVAAFLSWARTVSMPTTSPVFWAVDYDAAFVRVADYLAAAHDQAKAEGYLSGVYGSGAVCEAARNAGIAHYTWLAQSAGWNGFGRWAGQADIVQGASTTCRGLDVDRDLVRTQAVLW